VAKTPAAGGRRRHRLFHRWFASWCSSQLPTGIQADPPTLNFATFFERTWLRNGADKCDPKVSAEVEVSLVVEPCKKNKSANFAPENKSLARRSRTKGCRDLIPPP
jgi:hypothetical protein